MDDKAVSNAAPLKHEEGTSAPRPGAVAPGDGGERALRLDKRTHLDEARFKVSLTDYGDGLGEIGWSFVPTLQPFKLGKGLSPDREGNEDRACRRARSRLRKLILSTGADHLLTLTYRANVTDYDQASRDLGSFVRRVKTRVPGWVYIAIAERQERGAWHWHLAVRGRQDVALLRAVWLRVIGDGNIDVRAPSQVGRAGRLALAKYLGKYLSKGFASEDRGLNGRRFRASHGIVVPTRAVILPGALRTNPAVFAVMELQRTVGRVGFVWESPEGPSGWACSWD